MSFEIPSTSYDSTSSEELHSNDMYLEDVQATFWVVFVGWLICSVVWIVYCFVSHTRRLLQAYNNIDIEKATTNPLR